MKILICAILLSVCWFEGACSAGIVLKNNGYENVLVAMSDWVAEDPKLIEKIKEIFTDGSKNLYRATRYRAYFRHVTILLPSKWKTLPEYGSPANDETFEKAALRIDKPHPDPNFADRPYARTYIACGMGGLYIHLTPNYLNDGSKYGPKGKTLVHEWGHFRYGVADEYSTKTSQNYYIDNGEFHPTRCNSKIPGTNQDTVTKGPCKVDTTTGLPDKNCYFYVDRTQKATTASYMYKSWMDNTVDFCDDGTFGDTTLLHNKKAPNNLNTYCKGKSVWEVMRQNVDFKNNNNPPNANKNLDTTPTFKIIQPSNLTKVVLLFDVSGSMAGLPIKMMQQAANHFITNKMKTGSYIGIVTFSTAAQAVLGLTRIQTQADRTLVSQSIPTTVGGGTAIGSGMRHAIAVLQSTSGGKDWARGASVVLMTDGKHNSGAHPLDFIPEAIAAGITFHTIAYSDAADPNLETIARKTGGQSYFSKNDAKSAALFNALAAIADITNGGSSGTSDAASPVTVASHVNTVEIKMSLQGKFAIDFTIGKDTTITFNYLNAMALVEVRLEAPDGTVIDKSDTNRYRVDKTHQVIQIDIPGTAAKGEWKYTISTSNSDTAVVVNVLSKAVGEGEDAVPISVMSWFGGDNNTLAPGPGAQTSIFAKVSRGYSPVLGLKVVAALECSKTAYVTLQDKGFAADVESDDGIYSAKFGRFVVNEKGRCSVSIEVNNPDDSGKIPKYAKASGTPYVGPAPGASTPTYQTVGPMQRVTTAGELTVASPSSPFPVDVIPPPRIRNLRLVKLDIENVKLTLKWTAVGDDHSWSNKTVYDLRIGTFDEISKQFEKSSKIDLSGVPTKAGEEEEYEIDMTSYSKTATYFLSIRVIDEAGNKGDPSNIISVSMTVPTRFDNGDGVALSTNMLLIIIGSSIALLFVITIVVVIVCCWKKNTNIKKVHSSINPPQEVYSVGKKGFSPYGVDNVGGYIEA